MEQTFTLNDGQPATLTAHVWTHVHSGNGTDAFTIEVDGDTLATIGESDSAHHAAYAPVSIDLAAYADGQPHTLRFRSVTSGVGVTTFYLDDVCISNPEVLPQHTADVDESNNISLSELLRVIQFYNYQGLHCDAATEDGYAPAPGLQTCAAHRADYAPRDWRLGFEELLRVIQLYNSPSFTPCKSGEDGYCLEGAV